MITSSLNIIQMLPEITLLVVALVTLCADMILKPQQKSKLWDISFAGLMITLILTAKSFIHPAIVNQEAFFGQALADSLTVFIRLIIVSALFLTLIFSVDWLCAKPNQIGLFLFLTIISALGALVLSSANDLLIMLIGLEILSVPLYVLAGFQREKTEGREASFKYFILGSFASAFLALGIALIFMETSTINLSQIKLISITNTPINLPAKIGIALIIATFAFKGGLMPFYAWIPDVYSGSPDYVVGFMAAIAKVSVFAALIRIGVAFAPLAGSSLIGMLAVMFILTVIIGNLMALWQDDVKRMLAYSSIAHAGYLLLGLMAFNQSGISAIIFYLLIYAFTAIGAFVITGMVGQLRGNYSLKSFEGLFKQSPILALPMTIFMFSFSGMPPLAGFFSKMFLFNGAIDKALSRYVVVAALTSLIGVYYYLRVVLCMFMKPIPDGINIEEPEAPRFYTKTALLLSILLIFLLGFLPAPFYDAAYLYLKTLFI